MTELHEQAVETTAPRLTPEQARALEELIASMPRPAGPAADLQGLLPSFAGLARDWLGVSPEEMARGIGQVQGLREAVERRAVDWFERRPLEAALQFLTAASWAFYQAEKGRNAKVDGFVDAFYYITTCASVGYADIFPATHAGRAIASLVMIVGPAMTSRALDRPKVIDR